MTAPREEQPQESVPATPSVSTAPPRSRWRFGNVPSRLGRARTSTVVLAVLWVAVLVLWLFVRPPTPATGTTGSNTGTVETTAPSARTTPAPTTTEAPSTTATTTPPTTETTTPPTTEASTTPPETAPGTTTGSVGIPPTSATAPVS